MEFSLWLLLEYMLYHSLYNMKGLVSHAPYQLATGFGRIMPFCMAQMTKMQPSNMYV